MSRKLEKVVVGLFVGVALYACSAELWGDFCFREAAKEIPCNKDAETRCYDYGQAVCSNQPPYVYEYWVYTGYFDCGNVENFVNCATTATQEWCTDKFNCFWDAKVGCYANLLLEHTTKKIFVTVKCT